MKAAACSRPPWERMMLEQHAAMLTQSAAVGNATQHTAHDSSPQTIPTKRTVHAEDVGEHAAAAGAEALVVHHVHHDPLHRKENGLNNKRFRVGNVNRKRWKRSSSIVYTMIHCRESVCRFET